MNILYTVNDKYIPQVATGICSILENNKDVKRIVFYIISDGITESNKKKLQIFVKEYQDNNVRLIEFIELGDLTQYFDFNFDTLGWNKVILARLLLGRLLPKSIERILYLDGDTIDCGKLTDLWSLDLTGNILAASPEPTVRKSQIMALGMPATDLYCNSGVLLVDLVAWREQAAEKQIFTFYKKHDGKLFAADQDAINGALQGRIKYLPPKYNFGSLHYYYPYKLMKKLAKPAEYLSKNDYLEARKNPIIVHFLGEDRPWREWNNHPYKKEFYKYLNLTPWKGLEKETGWKTYFLFFNTFNVLTRPFPDVRYKVINSLIPTMMKIRARKLSSKK